MCLPYGATAPLCGANTSPPGGKVPSVSEAEEEFG